jgi:signal transduction histidine kinase
VNLFGAEHQSTIERFIGRLMNDSTGPAPIELVLECKGRPPRTLKVHGANRLDNAHINGLTLTVSDITEQRALERDVLTVANHERLRLAGDIHDGLGQELSGILLMLHGLAKSSSLGSSRQQDDLRAIERYVSEAIRGARDLARGLSPIYVVRGSLRDALRRLARDVGNKAAIYVDVDPQLDDLVVDELPADHLYRIAREAVQNCIRHSFCTRIDVRMKVQDENLLLEIADDGVGRSTETAPDSGFGLRLMEYRARVIGASFEITRGRGCGTVARVSVALWNVARRAAPAQ